MSTFSISIATDGGWIDTADLVVEKTLTFGLGLAVFQ